jgi:dihydropyrimidinase
MVVDLLLKNGTVVFPGDKVRKVDVGVVGGKIAGFYANSDGIEAQTVIDAANLHIFPGVIDPHMHIGIYNPLEKDFVEQTRAAAIGGITTLVNYFRGKESYHTYAPQLIETGEKNSLIDFTFSFGVLTQRHLSELEEIIKEHGITSYKFYRNYQDNIGKIFDVDDPLTLDAADMMEILDLFKKTSEKLVLCVHCEDMDLQRSVVKKLKEGAVSDTLAFFSKTSPDYAETASVMQALYLNKLVDGNMYIVHLSSGSSVDILEQMDWLRGEGVTLETCPHYLVLNEDSPCGLLAKVNPPIHTGADSEKLWEGIKKGLINTVGSDNCPCDLVKKYSKGRSVWDVLPGFPGAGMILPILISEGYHKRGIPLETVANVTSCQTAKALGLTGKGAVEIGADADFAVVDLDLEKEVKPEVFSGSDYSVYDGMKLKGWPVYTISRGEIIQKDGKITADQGRGRFIKR